MFSCCCALIVILEVIGVNLHPLEEDMHTIYEIESSISIAPC